MAKRIIKPDSGNTLVLQEDNGSIDALTVETNGDVTLAGNFTSKGIDDNATSTAVTIDSSGRVGIGTNSPVCRLEVEDAGTSASVLLKVTADDGSPYAIVVGNDYYSTSDTDGLAAYVTNTGEATLSARGTGSQLAFSTVGTERLRIDSSGNVELKTTSANLILPSGGGISFENHSVSGATGASSTASANVLDDYEEGTWTPTLVSFTETGTSTATGRYTKIGRIVYFSLEISTTGTIASTVNTSGISGLPFQVSYSTVAIQGGRGNWADAFKGNCLVFTDEKIYPETFSAQDDVILITGFYETT